jgi:hypothetical protein
MNADSKSIVKRLIRILFFVAAGLVLSGCQSLQTIESGRWQGRALQPIIEKIDKGESVAVSWIYEAGSYDITALGNCWRDRMENALQESGIRVKSRKDILFLIDDMESFGFENSQDNIWENAGADVIITGNYRVISSETALDRIVLHIKALRIKDAEIIGSNEWTETLASDWPQLASKRLGNVYYKKISGVVNPRRDGDPPALSAGLEPADACYASGEKGRVCIRTEAGVYIYLLNLIADDTVTLLYPNQLCPEKPIDRPEVEFPKDFCNDKALFVFYPLDPEKTCLESVKVIASRKPIDFSFLPVPVNCVYSGAEGGDIKRMYEVLKNADGWSEVRLTYRVGPECE